MTARFSDRRTAGQALAPFGGPFRVYVRRTNPATAPSL